MPSVRHAAGTYVLKQPLTITRKGVVLRGEGQARTKLYIPNSLSDVFQGTWSMGPNGGWAPSRGVWRGASRRVGGRAKAGAGAAGSGRRGALAAGAHARAQRRTVLHPPAPHRPPLPPRAPGKVRSNWAFGGAFLNFRSARQRSSDAATQLGTIKGPVEAGATRIPVRVPLLALQAGGAASCRRCWLLLWRRLPWLPLLPYCRQQRPAGLPWRRRLPAVPL